MNLCNFIRCSKTWRPKKFVKIYLCNNLMFVPVVFSGYVRDTLFLLADVLFLCFCFCFCFTARDQIIEQGKVKIRELHSNSL